MAKKLMFRQDNEPKKEEEEIAKKVVLDYASVKNAVQTIREFEKEYSISMLNPKGLQEASAILKKYEQQDKLQRFVEEKISEQIAPLDMKINRLTDMLTSLVTTQQQRKQELTEDNEIEKSVDKMRFP